MPPTTTPPLSIRKMAAGLGVSKSQVARDAQAGMPMTDLAAARTWRLDNHDVSRTKDGRIDRQPSQMRAANERSASQTPALHNLPAAVTGLATGASEGAADPAAPAGDEIEAPGDAAGEPIDEHTAAYREHRATREKVNAERGQLELDQLRGRLVDLEEIKRLGFTAYRSLRDAILNVPTRVKDQVAAESDAFKVEQLIEAELSSALASFDPSRLVADDDADEAD